MCTTLAHPGVIFTFYTYVTAQNAKLMIEVWVVCVALQMTFRKVEQKITSGHKITESNLS